MKPLPPAALAMLAATAAAAASAEGVELERRCRREATTAAAPEAAFGIGAASTRPKSLAELDCDVDADSSLLMPPLGEWSTCQLTCCTESVLENTSALAVLPAGAERSEPVPCPPASEYVLELLPMLDVDSAPECRCALRA